MHPKDCSLCSKINEKVPEMVAGVGLKEKPGPKDIVRGIKQ
jgi:hypothetical protein